MIAPILLAVVIVVTAIRVSGVVAMPVVVTPMIAASASITVVRECGGGHGEHHRGQACQCDSEHGSILAKQHDGSPLLALKVSTPDFAWNSPAARTPDGRIRGDREKIAGIPSDH